MPIDPAKPPDEKAIKEYAQHLQDTWADAHALYRKLDTYYQRTYSVWPDEDRFANRPFRRPSTPTRIIDQAVDVQLARTPLVRRPPTGDTDEALERADRVENGLAALLTDAFLLEPVMPVKGAKKQLLLYGYTPLYGPFLDLRYSPTPPERNDDEEQDDFEARVAEWESRRFSWNPLRLRHLHPQEVLLDPSDTVPPVGLRSHKIKAGDLLGSTTRRLQRAESEPFKIQGETFKAFDLEQRDPYDLVPIIEWWSASWHALALTDGELLFVERNGWGFQPLSQAFSGFGQIPTDADRLNPKDLSKGILEPVLDDIRAQAQAASAIQNMVVQGGFPRRGYDGDAAQGAELLTGDMLPGKKDDWWIEEVPVIPQQIFDIAAGLEREIELGTFASSLGGFRQSGVNTVGQQAILDASARSKFASIEIGTDHMFSVVASNMLRLADVLHDEAGIQSLSMRGSELRVTDIDHNYRVMVEFRDIDPVLLSQLVDIALREYQAGLLSDEDYWKATGKEDGSGIRERLMLQRLRETPEYMAVAAGAIAKERGLRKLANRLEQQGGISQQLLGPHGQPITSGRDTSIQGEAADMGRRLGNELSGNRSGV